MKTIMMTMTMVIIMTSDGADGSDAAENYDNNDDDDDDCRDSDIKMVEAVVRWFCM